jgi:hypothetical protein
MNKKEIIGLCEFLRIHHFENAYTLLDYFEEKDKEIQRLNEELEEYKKDFKETNDLAFEYKNIIEKIEEALRTRMYPDIARSEALSIINRMKQLKEVNK